MCAIDTQAEPDVSEAHESSAPSRRWNWAHHLMKLSFFCFPFYFNLLFFCLFPSFFYFFFSFHFLLLSFFLSFFWARLVLQRTWETALRDTENSARQAHGHMPSRRPWVPELACCVHAGKSGSCYQPWDQAHSLQEEGGVKAGAW